YLFVYSFLRWNNHKVTHSHKIMMFKILKLVLLEMLKEKSYCCNKNPQAEEKCEAPNPVQPPAPATMGDKGKRIAIVATPIG
ncbi:hypothetical protein S83_033401, partial [Arachis hypogaea]